MKRLFFLSLLYRRILEKLLELKVNQPSVFMYGVIEKVPTFLRFKEAF
jgi:hypothetical protein